MTQDLFATRERMQRGDTRAALEMTASLAEARSQTNRATYTALSADVATEAAAHADAAHAAGGPLPPLAGLAVSIKDLFDVAGEVTAAGSTALAKRPAALQDCPAVARLRAAGAALLGRTNMSEFAFSGVGINPHFGTPANPTAALVDPTTQRAPGGSSSGGATSVATGAAWAALGSDTGGSIRIPAALQGLVGFKNTARLTPTEGAIPLSTTLDTVCAITRSVRDAVQLHEVLAQRTVRATTPPLSHLRFKVPRTLMLDGLDATVTSAFARTLATLRKSGAQVEEIDMPQLADLASINAGGGFAPVEAWAWHRALMADCEAQYDPRVALRIRRGAQMSGADYIDLLQARQAWIAQMLGAMRGVDAMLSPTVPFVAPAIAPLLASDDAFFAANGALLRNPSVVNVLDGCALSLPCHVPGELPVGLMVWSGALCDDVVLGASLAIEAALAPMRAGAA